MNSWPSYIWLYNRPKSEKADGIAFSVRGRFRLYRWSQTIGPSLGVIIISIHTIHGIHHQPKYYDQNQEALSTCKAAILTHGIHEILSLLQDGCHLINISRGNVFVIFSTLRVGYFAFNLSQSIFCVTYNIRQSSGRLNTCRWGIIIGIRVTIERQTTNLVVMLRRCITDRSSLCS